MIFKGFISCHNKIKLLIKNKEIFGKYSNIWELNNISLNANGSKKEITQVRKYIGINENDNATHPNFQDVIKSEFRKKKKKAYSGRGKQSRINYLNFY